MKDNNKIITMLEDFDLKPEQIDEIMIRFEELKDNYIYREGNITRQVENKYVIIKELEEQINKETDWKKKAILASKLLSLKIEYE